MNPQLKDKLARAVHKVLRTHGVTDPISVAEDVMEKVSFIYDIETEEAGIAPMPENLDPKDLPWSDNLPPARNAVVPAKPQEKSEVIILPGDPRFADAKPADLPERKLVASPGALQRSRRSAAPVSDVQYWDYSDLITALEQATPLWYEFDTIGPEERPIKLRVERNIQAQIAASGMPGGVMLSYKHPQVSDNITGRVAVDLIAKHVFSLCQKELDITAAMQSLDAQLKTMYRAKPPQLNPQSGPAPGPLGTHSLRTSPMKDRDEIRLDYSQGSYSDPYAEKDKDEVLRQVTENLRRSNDALAPTDKRF